MATQIRRILETQDVDNRRVFAGSPNGKVYGQPGWTCQDSANGLFYYFGSATPGQTGWVQVGQSSQGFVVIGSDDSGVALNPVDFSVFPLGNVIITGNPAGTQNICVVNPDGVTNFTYAGAGLTILELNFISLKNIVTININTLTVANQIFCLNLADLVTFACAGSDLVNRPVFTGCVALTTIELSTSPNLTNAPVVTGLVSLSNILLVDCPGINAAEVDAFYIALAANTLADNGTADTSGTTGNATAASLAARNALIARGWTIVL